MSSSPSLNATPSPTLPSLPPPSVTPSFQSQLAALPRRNPRLPHTNAYVFTHNLFSRTLLETTLATIQIRCMQPNCHYGLANWTLQAQSTGNLIRHYEAHYPAIPTSLRKAKQQIPSSDLLTFFAPNPCRPVPVPSIQLVDNAKCRELLLDFVVANNLALRIVDTPKY